MEWEATVEGQRRLVYSGRDFRMYEANLVRDASGKPIRVSRVCKEFVDGRWEPFVSVTAASEEGDHA